MDAEEVSARGTLKKRHLQIWSKILELKPHAKLRLKDKIITSGTLAGRYINSPADEDHYYLVENLQTPAQLLPHGIIRSRDVDIIDISLSGPTD
mmetsp:Transcript_50438/g.57864  ORF Transcript_50438/g.57864 Transcript_50438/m.57864 type:complete len:94 (+) Transcript_50438:211-492(+)